MSVRSACLGLFGLIAAACLALACKDPGVIGETNACVPSCEDGMLCETDKGRCVACLSSDDCEEDARCVSNACVARETIRDPMLGDGDDGDGDDNDGDDGDDSSNDGDEQPPGDDEGAAGEGGDDEG
jgi:hypothetical protein